MNLNELRKKAYKTACDHGFHDKELSNEHWLCLVVSELSEAVEADRKGKYFDFSNNDFDQYCRTSDRDGFSKAFEYHIKDTVSDELADAFIRLLDLYGLRGIDLNEDVFDNETICEYAIAYQGKSFTECVYRLISELTSRHHQLQQSAVLPEVLLLELLGLASHLNIDLVWHVEQKMKYNQSRERLHGKKY